MPQRSAGLLVYRRRGTTEMLLAHPGGPFWKGKDLGAWTIPKGLCESGEDALVAALREFREEMGSEAPAGPFAPLGEFKQPGGKVIAVFAVEGDFDCTRLASNSFTLEWPPKSGRQQQFPEIDRAAWFALADARRKILKGQAPILAALMAKLARSSA